MFVKICGLTNLSDTLAAAASGAQAVGFNFVPSSPRYLAPLDLASWIGQLPTNLWKVGVFADELPAHVAALCERLGLDVAQLHGNETPTQLPAVPRIWKAARVRTGEELEPLDAFKAEALLLDGPASGIPFDWRCVPADERKLILAGGLHPDNVREAIHVVRPWGVDVSSRIELSPGKKDHRLMAKFIDTALSC